MAGRHQIDNAAVAMRLLETVNDRGFPVSAAAMRTGLSAVHWPARLEHLTWRGASVLLDAAHNPAGAAALASYLQACGWQGATLVFGAMRDKDVAGILAPLAAGGGTGHLHHPRLAARDARRGPGRRRGTPAAGRPSGRRDPGATGRGRGRLRAR